MITPWWVWACGLDSTVISFNVKINDIWEENMTIRSEIKTENNHSTWFQNIRGVTLRRWGCIIKWWSVQMVANRIKRHICLPQKYLHLVKLCITITLSPREIKKKVSHMWNWSSHVKDIDSYIWTAHWTTSQNKQQMPSIHVELPPSGSQTIKILGGDPLWIAWAFKGWFYQLPCWVRAYIPFDTILKHHTKR